MRLADALQRPSIPLPGRLYADDVILHVSQLWELIMALRISERWANEYDMTWSLEKRKSQLLLDAERARQVPSLPFAGGNIKTVTIAKYLGTMLTAAGVSPESWKKRAKAVHSTISALCSSRLLFPGLPANYVRTVYTSMIQSTMDYAAFLSPLNLGAAATVNCADARFFSIALGMNVKQNQVSQIKLLFRLDTRQLRNNLLAKKFQERMTDLTKCDRTSTVSQAIATLEALRDNSLFQSHLSACAKMSSAVLRKQHRERIAHQMKRSVPPHGIFPAALQLLEELRTCAVKWHLGVFPIEARVLRRIGYGFVLDELKLLSKHKLHTEEWSRLKSALTIAAAVSSLTELRHIPL